MSIHIIDFAWHGGQTLFVEFTVEVANGFVKGMVRIVDGAIYGDVIHPKRSQLSVEEINAVKHYLAEKVQAGKFE